MLVQWYNFCHKKLDHRHLSCWQQCWQYFVYSWMLHLLEYRVAIAVSEEISASIFRLKSFEEEIWKHQFPHKVDQNLPVCMTTYCRIFKIFHYRKCSRTFFLCGVKSPNWANVTNFRNSFMAHNQTCTPSTTVLNEWSALSGIRNLDPNTKAAACLRLRPHGNWHRPRNTTANFILRN